MKPTSSGQTTNAITPAFWSDEFAVFTAAPHGTVEVLKLKGKTNSDHGVEFSAADSVANTTISDGGCCANAIWLQLKL